MNEAAVAMDGVAIVIIALLGAGFVAAAAGAARLYFAHYLPLLRATQQAAVVTYPEAVASSTLPSPDRQRRRSSNGAGQARAEPPAPLVLPQEGPHARLQDGGGGSMHTARAAESMLAVPDAVLDGEGATPRLQLLLDVDNGAGAGTGAGVTAGTGAGAGAGAGTQPPGLFSPAAGIPGSVRGWAPAARPCKAVAPSGGVKHGSAAHNGAAAASDYVVARQVPHPPQMPPPVPPAAHHRTASTMEAAAAATAVAPVETADVGTGAGLATTADAACMPMTPTPAPEPTPTLTPGVDVGIGTTSAGVPQFAAHSVGVGTSPRGPPRTSSIAVATDVASTRHASTSASVDTHQAGTGMSGTLDRAAASLLRAEALAAQRHASSQTTAGMGAAAASSATAGVQTVPAPGVHVGSQATPTPQRVREVGTMAAPPSPQSPKVPSRAEASVATSPVRVAHVGVQRSPRVAPPTPRDAHAQTVQPASLRDVQLGFSSEVAALLTRAADACTAGTAIAENSVPRLLAVVASVFRQVPATVHPRLLVLACRVLGRAIEADGTAVVVWVRDMRGMALHSHAMAACAPVLLDSTARSDAVPMEGVQAAAATLTRSMAAIACGIPPGKAAGVSLQDVAACHAGMGAVEWHAAARVGLRCASAGMEDHTAGAVEDACIVAWSCASAQLCSPCRADEWVQLASRMCAACTSPAKPHVPVRHHCVLLVSVRGRWQLMQWVCAHATDPTAAARGVAVFERGSALRGERVPSYTRSWDVDQRFTRGSASSSPGCCCNRRLWHRPAAHHPCSTIEVLLSTVLGPGLAQR